MKEMVKWKEIFAAMAFVLSKKQINRCRDQLKRNYNMGNFWLEVDLDDLASFNEQLAEKINKQPTEHLPMVRCKCTATLLRHWLLYRPRSGQMTHRLHQL